MRSKKNFSVNVFWNVYSSRYDFYDMLVYASTT